MPQQVLQTAQHALSEQLCAFGASPAEEPEKAIAAEKAINIDLNISFSICKSACTTKRFTRGQMEALYFDEQTRSAEGEPNPNTGRKKREGIGEAGSKKSAQAESRLKRV